MDFKWYVASQSLSLLEFKSVEQNIIKWREKKFPTFRLHQAGLINNLWDRELHGAVKMTRPIPKADNIFDR